MLCVAGGGAVAPNGVYAETLDGQGYVSPSIGFSITDYKAGSKDWIYGKAPITWRNSTYKNSFFPYGNQQPCL